MGKMKDIFFDEQMINQFNRNENEDGDEQYYDRLPKNNVFQNGANVLTENTTNENSVSKEEQLEKQYSLFVRLLNLKWFLPGYATRFSGNNKQYNVNEVYYINEEIALDILRIESVYIENLLYFFKNDYQELTKKIETEFKEKVKEIDEYYNNKLQGIRKYDFFEEIEKDYNWLNRKVLYEINHYKKNVWGYNPPFYQISKSLFNIRAHCSIMFLAYNIFNKYYNEDELSVKIGMFDFNKRMLALRDGFNELKRSNYKIEFEIGDRF